MRVCGPCLDGLMETLGLNWINVSGEPEGELPSVCAACGQGSFDDGRLNSFFATVYRKGQEKEDFYALYCPNCSSDLIQTLELTSVSA